MTLSEIRKGVIAVLGAIVAVVPQVLSSLAGVIPVEAASWLTVTASVATAVLVYLVPNEKRTVVETVQSSVQALEPAVEQIGKRIRERVEEEIAARLPVSPRVQAHAREPEVQPDPKTLADPFVVPPLGR